MSLAGSPVRPESPSPLVGRSFLSRADTSPERGRGPFREDLGLRLFISIGIWGGEELVS